MNASGSEVSRVLVSGARACFRRPEFKSDLISYDIMPPTVARQLLKVILGEGGWTLDRIGVCKPIRFGWESLTTARGQKRAMVLIDVAYLLEVSGTSMRTEMVEDRDVARIHLGLDNYPASARLLDATEQVTSCSFGPERTDLGWMIYDTRPPGSRFFRAVMFDGVVDVRRSESLLLAS